MNNSPPEPPDHRDGSAGSDDEDLTADSRQALKFRHFQQLCPACGMPITEEMDSCPYCGDIIFRSLRHGTFVPRRGLPAKLFAVIVVALAILGAIMFLWSWIAIP